MSTILVLPWFGLVVNAAVIAANIRNVIASKGTLDSIEECRRQARLAGYTQGIEMARKIERGNDCE